MMDILNKLNISEKSVLFQYNLEPHDVDDGVQYIIVDNKNNFLEIDSVKIVCSYTFTFPITKIERISVFYSYQPKVKYYLILFDGFIIVLKKTNELSFVERINEVSHFYISDYYDTGRLQVVIRLLGKDQPLVTDFAHDSAEHKVTLETENRVLYGLNLTILSQMQSLNVRVKEAENQLEEKSQMVSKLTSGMVYNSRELVNVPCNAQVLGSPATSAARCEPMSVGVPWVRSYLGKWIVGFPVSNLQEYPISRMKVFISSRLIYVENTILFVPRVKTLEGSEFKVSQSLQSHKIGILAAIMKEPTFTENVINFSCNATFCYGNEIEKHQIYLGEISVKVEDLMSNKLQPFCSSKSFRDILAHISVSTKTQLHLKDPENKQPFLNSLKDNYGFIPVTDRYTVNIMGNSVFTGVLVSVETNNYVCIVDFYTKDSRQLALLLQCLHKYQFEAPYFLSRPEPDLKAFQTSIKEEMKAIKTVITGNYVDTPCTASSLSPVFNNDDNFQALRYLNHYETDTFQNIYN